MAGYQIGDVALVVRHSIVFMMSGMQLLKATDPPVENESVKKILH